MHSNGYQFEGPHPVYSGDIVPIIQELHKDLARKWRQHEQTVRDVWQELGRSKREDILNGSITGGIVLKDREDDAFGEMCFIVPEWNLHELAEPKSDLLLDLIHHRASTWLSDQYIFGPNNGLGDEGFILELIHQSNTTYEELVSDHFRCFASEYHYGEEINIPEDQRGGQNGTNLPRGTQPAIVGNYILVRQMHFLQFMNMTIWEILSLHWKKEHSGVNHEKPQRPGTMGLIGLCIIDDPPKFSLHVLIEMVSDNRKSLEDWAWLCRTDTEYLIEMIYVWFFTQSGFIPDGRGLLLPAALDRNVSACVFEMLHTFVLSAAIWDYLARLLSALVETKEDDRFYRAALLHELVNVIHYEYGRAQALLKRYTQRSIGHRHLKRVDGPQSNDPRVILKTKPAKLTRSDPLGHYILRLFQSETKVADAGHWLRQALAIYSPDKWSLGFRDALHELATIVGLYKHLKLLVQLPPKSNRKGQRYINQLTEMKTDVDAIKESLDLSELVVPPEHLRCPKVTESALNKVDEVIEDYTGTKLSKLYEEINDDCFLQLRRVADEKQAQEERAKEVIASSPLHSTEDPVKSIHIEERSPKIKRRPVKPQAPLTGRKTVSKEPLISPTREPEPIEILNVKAESYDVFRTLLSRDEPRGSLAWSAFIGAMADLGFSVHHKYGSVVSFEPPRCLGYMKAFTFHRPHGSHIEGFRLLWLSRRVRRVYDWTIGCFQAM